MSTVGLSVKVETSNLNSLKSKIDYLKKLVKMKTDKTFQEYIQRKCLDTVNKVANERIYLHNTTNTDMRQEYLRNNKIRDDNISGGFIIYNDTFVSVDNPSYPNGRFSIAMAFEYGTGIIGEENPVIGAWDYDVNGNLVYDNETGEEIRGWWLNKYKNGSTPYVKESKNGNAVVTQGYQGMEIYRYSAEEIRKNLPKWVKEYFNKREEV